ncbi:MAG: DUF192 domain-containing protein [Proteobacteria bacterium]|nr:DUF192 domain-containing protein [Pseudomonadota bacterium]
MPRAPSIFASLLATATLAALLLCLPPARAQSAGQAQPLSSFPRTQLQVTTHGRASHRFDVWVADTPERAAQGLMFVSDLPDNKGMVFPLDPPRVESMWMKNTYIELDMLFVRSDGRISKIIERAHPLSLETLSSEAPVAAVVELRGGLVAKLGLKIGDVVRWDKPASN